MNKKLPILTAVLSLTMVFTSCSQAVTPEVTTTATAASSTTSEATTETTVKERAKLDHTFNPHCISDVFVKKFGKEFEENYYRYCDAILSGAKTVKCDKKEWLPMFHDISRVFLPIVNQYCYCILDEIEIADNGEYVLSYSIPKDEFLKKVDEFKTRVEYLIESACYEGDTPFEMTLALYHSESNRISYDYRALEDGYESPDGLAVSPYRALMSDTGICQEIAGAYAYLLMQVGVDAITCGAVSKDSSVAHEWTIVNIDGKYYHCDVTYQLSEPGRLNYFGMNDAKREAEGDWDMPYNNIGEINEIWHKDLPLEDTRFELLWSALSYKVDRDTHKLLCYDSYDCTGNMIFEVPLG